MSYDPSGNPLDHIAMENIPSHTSPDQIDWHIYMGEKEQEEAINTLIAILKNNKSWTFSHQDAEASGMLEHLPDRFFSTQEQSDIYSLGTEDEGMEPEDLESSLITEPFIKKVNNNEYTLTGAAIYFLRGFKTPRKGGGEDLFETLCLN